jgi:hypothetical protein
VVVGVLGSLAGSWLLGLRPDLALALATRRFLMINTMLLIALGGVAFILGTLSIPGRQWRLKVQLIVGAIAFGIIVGMFLMRWPWFYGMNWRLWCDIGIGCTIRTLLLGAPATGAGMWLHRHGAPVNPGVSGGLIGAASGTQGANAMGWSCPVDEPMHVLLSHFLLPVAMMALAGMWAGRRWLRW